MTDELARTLAMIAQVAQGSADPWWIIGSAAVLLHGGKVDRIKDVDLMMSAADAAGFVERTGVSLRRGSGDGRFRSGVIGIWELPPVPVEAFGGLEVLTSGEWRPVMLASRKAVTVGGAELFVPSVEELVALLHLFGRPKDLERARLLSR